MLACLFYKQFYSIVKWVDLKGTNPFRDFQHFLGLPPCLSKSLCYKKMFTLKISETKTKRLKNPFEKWCHWGAQLNIKQNPSICGMLDSLLFYLRVRFQLVQAATGLKLTLNHKFWRYSKSLRDNDVLLPPKNSRMFEIWGRKKHLCTVYCEKC
jgi:hypothetical protein